MNNGDFNNGEQGRTPGPGTILRPGSGKKLFPTVILIMGVLGLMSPSWSVTAIVCAAIDRHLSGKWDTKTRIGLIIGSLILAFYTFMAVIGVVSYLTDPNLSSTFLGAIDALEKMAQDYSTYPFM